MEKQQIFTNHFWLFCFKNEEDESSHVAYTKSNTKQKIITPQLINNWSFYFLKA